MTFKSYFLNFLLIFLIYGCASTESLISDGQVYKGMSKTSLRNLLLDVYPSEDPFVYGSFSEYNSSKRKKYGDRIIKFYKEMEELDSEWKKNSWWDRFCSDEYQLLKHDSELNNPPLINIKAPSPY